MRPSTWAFRAGPTDSPLEFLVGLAIAGALIVAAMFLLLAVLLKAVWWAVTLPVRLAFYLLLLPIWLAGRALRIVALGIMAPVLAVAGMLLAGLVILAGLVAVLAPLLPIVVITLLAWMLLRNSSRHPVRVP